MNIFSALENEAIRNYPEKEHISRKKFDRDRDRIMYSKGFRRLSGKTQVFVAGFDDHLRTRLTHTLEVAQISKTIAKIMRLNESLCEAIALGHDIGHTPFGHVGERALNTIMNGCYRIKDFNVDLPQESQGFKHNWQGLRVLSHLENTYRNYQGLNLTDYTLWGILHHSKLEWGKCSHCIGGNCSLMHKNEPCINGGSNMSIDFYKNYLNYLNETSWSMEGQVVSWADEIAQRHHDIQDGIEAKIINKSDFIDAFRYYFKEGLSNKHKKILRQIEKEDEKSFYMSELSRFIVNFFVTSLISNSEMNLKSLKEALSIKTNKEFHSMKSEISNTLGINHIKYSEGFGQMEKKLQKYLAAIILNSYLAQSMDGKSNYVIRQLFKAYLTNPQQLPDKTILSLYRVYYPEANWDRYLQRKTTPALVALLRKHLNKDHHQDNKTEYRTAILRTVCDYIAGMTDQYAMDQYNLLYGGKTKW